MNLPVPHHHLIDRIAVINAVLGSIALYPQLYLIVYGDIDLFTLSLTSFALIFANSLIWLWYGIHIRNKPLIISSLLNGFAAGGIIYFVLTHI